MEYELMDDFEINCAVALLCVSGAVSTQAVSNDSSAAEVYDKDGYYICTVNYLKNPSDTWSVISKYKIGGHYGRASSNLYFAVSRCERFVEADVNPLRACAIVALMIKGAENGNS